MSDDKGKGRLTEITEDETLPSSIEMAPNDLIILFNTVGVCAKRGAFGVEEFKDIGALHDRLKGYLKPWIDQQQKAQEAAGATGAGGTAGTASLE